MSTASIAEARNRLPQIVKQAEAGIPVLITRHGKPVAVLVSAAEYGRLQNGPAAPKSVWETIMDWRAANAAFDWPDLMDGEVEGWRDRTSPREGV